MFALLYRWVTQIKLISDINSYSWQNPQFRFFKVVKGGEEVSLELQGLDGLQLKIICRPT